MKKFAFLFTIALVTISCKNKNENKSSVEEPNALQTEKPKTMLEIGCYSYDQGDNHIVFEITGIEDSITGNLRYSLSEKDANTGTFIGHTEGDKLIGTYTFMSEGSISDREVAFMVKDQQLIEGFGPLNNSGTGFVDKNTILYSSKMPLSKTDCTP